MTLDAIALSILMIYMLINTRWVIYCIITYKLNKSAYRKKKKGQNFKDWFLYRRFREQVPSAWYYIHLSLYVIYIICLALILILGNISWDYFIIKKILGVLLYTSLVYSLILDIALWSSKKGHIPMERWIKKK